MFRFGRRLISCLLCVVLVTGALVYAARAAQADLTLATMTIAAEATMPDAGPCKGCCDDQGSPSPAACSAYCAGIVAVQVDGIELGDRQIAGRADIANVIATSRTVSPDPPPPRAHGLS
jgi:hypothetical protein